MIFDLKQILNISGEKLDFDYEFNIENPIFGQLTFQNPVKINGFFQNRAGIASLHYKVNFEIKALCDRCLKEFNLSFENSFEHLLIKFLQSITETEKVGQTSLNDMGEDFIVCENENIDLDKLSTDDIILGLPTKLLCNDNCKGLCSQCGANLNFEKCNCNNKVVDPRLEILKDLL